MEFMLGLLVGLLILIFIILYTLKPWDKHRLSEDWPYATRQERNKNIYLILDKYNSKEPKPGDFGL